MLSPQTVVEETFRVFKHRFTIAPALAVFAPGRLNIIGEHTDYNEGHVLPFANDLGVCAAVRTRADRSLALYAANFNEAFTCDADAIPASRPAWVSHIVGVYAELETTLGEKLRGKEIAVFGNLPIGSGLSSSAALEIAVATAIERAEGLDLDDAMLVDACRRADRNHVGVNSGPMDQFASRACKAGHAGLLDCRSLEMTHHRIPDGLAFLSVDSGIPRSLAGSAYNERVAACARAVSALAKNTPSVRALRDATKEMLEAARQDLDERTYRLAYHVVTEQERVFNVIETFASGDFIRLGELLSEGHRSLSSDYRVSTPLLDAMVGWLERQDGVFGVRLTGAGFGGSLICACDAMKLDVESITAGFLAEFAAKTPKPPTIYRLSATDGARYRKSFLP